MAAQSQVERCSEQLAYLRQWIESNGGFVSQTIRCHFTENAGSTTLRGLGVSASHATGDLLVDIPFACLIAGSLPVELVESLIGSTLLGSSSFFFPYISTLPPFEDHLHDVLFSDTELLQEFSLLRIAHLIASFQDQMKSYWAGFNVPDCFPLIAAGIRTPRLKFVCQTFTWALLSVKSRGFTTYNGVAMVPLLDLVNTALPEYQNLKVVPWGNASGLQSFRAFAMRPISAGDELFDAYTASTADNEEIAYRYNLVLNGNIHKVIPTNKSACLCHQWTSKPFWKTSQTLSNQRVILQRLAIEACCS
jgi:hypothetical protein